MFLVYLWTLGIHFIIFLVFFALSHDYYQKIIIETITNRNKQNRTSRDKIGLLDFRKNFTVTYKHHKPSSRLTSG